MFFVYENTLITPPLEGSILHGVTRESVLELSKQFGYKVEERRLDIQDVMEDIKSNKIKEVFGSGTAAVISPVGTLCYKGENVTIGDGNVGIFTQKLYDKLTNIQCGKEEDIFGWVHKIPKQ